MKLLALKHQSPNMKSAFLPLSQLCEMQKKTKLPFFLSYLDLGYIFRRVFDLWNPDIYIYIYIFYPAGEIHPQNSNCVFFQSMKMLWNSNSWNSRQPQGQHHLWMCPPIPYLREAAVGFLTVKCCWEIAQILKGLIHLLCAVPRCHYLSLSSHWFCTELLCLDNCSQDKSCH